VSNNQEQEEKSSTSSLAATIVTKPAKTDHPINELIAKRWSARAFSTRPVEKSKLLSAREDVMHSKMYLIVFVILVVVVTRIINDSN
jgi:hypothetical protein